MYPLHHFSLVLIVGLLASGVASDGDFGECESDKNGCSECYFALVKALLGSDDNVFNLSQVFTPPTSDQPTYVTVNYRFFNCSENDGNVSSNVSCIDENHTWLWAKSGAYLLYPLATFQFISLLFGNAEHLYEREVHVTLDATDCYGVSADHIALLTQRLKIHILEQNYYPKMEESYKAVAVNDNSVEEVFFNSFYSGDALSSEHILFVCPIMVIAALFIIMIVIFVLHIGKWILKKNHHGFKTPMKVNMVSFSIISFVRLAIFIVLDGLAVHYELPCTDPRVTSVCKFVQLLYHVPLALLVGDLILMMFLLSSVALSITLKLKGVTKFKDCHYYCLIIPIACLIFSCILHTPYITMAYLSDAHYATSVLVYYMTILFIELGLIHHTLKVFFDLRNRIKRKHLFDVVAVAAIIVLLVVVYGLVISLSLFYYYIPINNTITDLPNEGIIVYQTALLLAGAYITYKAVFQKEKKLKEIHALDDSLCRMKKAEIKTLKSEIAFLKLLTDSSSNSSTSRAKVTWNGKRVEVSELQGNASVDRTSLAHCISNVHKRRKTTIKDRITQKTKRINVLRKEIQLVHIHRSIMHLSNVSSSPSSEDNNMVNYNGLQTQEKDILKSLRRKIPPKEFSFFEKRRVDRRIANGETPPNDLDEDEDEAHDRHSAHDQADNPQVQDPADGPDAENENTPNADLGARRIINCLTTCCTFIRRVVRRGAHARADHEDEQGLQLIEIQQTDVTE